MITSFQIFEKVSNVVYAEHIFNKMIEDMKKIDNDLLFSLEKNKIYWRLEITSGFDLPIDNIEKIKRIINKYKKELQKVNIILSYEDISVYGFEVFYKDINLGRVKPNKYYYHSTQQYNLYNIMKNGLLPRTNYQNYLSYPPSVFVSDEKHIFQVGDILLRIDTDKSNNKWYKDINHEKGRYMTFEKVSPSSIELVDSETLKPIDLDSFEPHQDIHSITGWI